MVEGQEVTLFVDLDGVLGDWNKNTIKHFGPNWEKIPKGILWSRINKIESFWFDIEPYDYLHDFFNILRPYNPIILTGCPKSNFEDVSDQKKRWIQKHLDVEVITCLSKDKHLHMRNPGDILIDDLIKNCNSWESHGGIAINHDSLNHESTLEEFKRVVEN